MSIRKIAKLAGVSTSTVSRVLNDHPYVTAEKREKVLAVMKKLDYVPNRNAITLSSGESGIIGLVVPYIRNSCYDQLVESVLAEATQHHKKVMLLPTYFNQELEKDYYTLLRDKTLDGIIVTSKTQDDHFLKELNQYGPVVTTEKTRFPEIASVYPDRFQVYHQVFAYLSGLTQFPTIFVTATRNIIESNSTKIRMEVFQEYFPTHKPEEVLIDGIVDYYDGYAVGKKLFEAHDEPVMIYSNGDEVGAGIYKAAQERERILGRDYYLIGEDNQLFSELLAIDTVDFKLKEVGKQAVRHLLDKSKEHRVITCDFIQRAEKG